MNKEFEVNGVQYMAVDLYSNVTGEFWLENEKDDLIVFFIRPLPPFGNIRRMKRLKGRAGNWEIVGQVGKLSLSDIHFKVFSYKSGYYDPEADSREAEAALYNEFTELCEKHNLNDNTLIIKKI